MLWHLGHLFGSGAMLLMAGQLGVLSAQYPNLSRHRPTRHHHAQTPFRGFDWAEVLRDQQMAALYLP